MADETEIAASSACFCCMSPLQQLAAIVYLLNEIHTQDTGTSFTVEQVASGADSFRALTLQQKNAAEVYLLDQIL